MSLLKRNTLDIFSLSARAAATSNSDPINCKEFGKASLLVRTGTETGTPDARTLDVKLQGSLDESGDNWVDIASGAITQITAASSNQQKYDVAIHGMRRVRVVHTLAFTNGTTPTLQTQVVLGLYQ